MTKIFSEGKTADIAMSSLMWFFFDLFLMHLLFGLETEVSKLKWKKKNHLLPSAMEYQ